MATSRLGALPAPDYRALATARPRRAGPSGSNLKPAPSKASVTFARNRRNVPLPGRLLSTTIRRSMSSDMRRIKRCARLSAEPPPNTSRTWQSAQLNGGDRRKRLDDVEILFDPRRARQPEIRLDLEHSSRVGS